MGYNKWEAKLQGDRHRRAAEAGSVVESILASDPPLIRKACIQMQEWYKEAVERPPLLFMVPGGTYFHLEPSHAMHTRLRKY